MKLLMTALTIMICLTNNLTAENMEATDENQSNQPFRQIRNLTLPDVNDRPVSLSDYLGNTIIILDFWASWCAPCMKLMPELDKIHENNDDVTVIGINVDQPRSVNRAKSLLRSHKYSLITLFDTNQEIMKRFQVTSVPHSYIIGYDGEIIYEHTGYTMGDETKYLKKIAEYRNKR